MIRVVVGDTDSINSSKAGGTDGTRSHSNVRFVCPVIFGCQRIRQIRIDQYASAIPLKQKAALAQPPEAKTAIQMVRLANVIEKQVVLEERSD